MLRKEGVYRVQGLGFRVGVSKNTNGFKVKA